MTPFFFVIVVVVIDDDAYFGTTHIRRVFARKGAYLHWLRVFIVQNTGGLLDEAEINVIAEDGFFRRRIHR